MINKSSVDQLDEAIDCFERDWSPRSLGGIRSLLNQFDLGNDHSAITELIRIDIELRYNHGLSFPLDDYFREFDGLLTSPESVAQIAFEDYRSRVAHGHSMAVSRWQQLPGIGDQSWYRDLVGKTSARKSQLKNRPPIGTVADVGFEEALEKIGFRLVEELGSGAFSKVYLATQDDLADRHVVLKVVRQALAEPQNMAMLQHTNIVPIYSFHRIQSRSVICMPYAGGLTLSDYLSCDDQASSRGGQGLVSTVLNQAHDTVVDSEPTDAEDDNNQNGSTRVLHPSDLKKPLESLQDLDCSELALWIFGRLAGALAHSHARGLLHGDLKPANVLIRNDGEPALLDFNLAQSLDRKQIAHVGGTLPYMPPESYRALMGQSLAPHSSSDVYALGVMLYEFVTGRLPYSAPQSTSASDLEPAIKDRSNPVQWRSEDSGSPGLRRIVERCLLAEPDQRYSAEQLREDLQRESENKSLSHTTEPTTYQATKWLKRHPKAVSASTAGVLLICLMIPLGLVAIGLKQQSDHMSVVAQMDAFADRSADVLSTTIVNPLRHQDDLIVAALEPLEEFGILNPDRENEFQSALLTPEQIEQHRDTAFRHVAQVAYAEIDWLSSRNEAAIDRASRKRLDRLVDAAERIQGDIPSRALLFIRADQALLSGKTDQFKKLSKKAAKVLLSDSNDTERYLEAIRLYKEREYAEARKQLTELADSDIPSALRWTMLGRAQFQSGKYEDAKLSFTQSIEHAPTASRLWYLRARCFTATNMYRRAADDLSKAIDLEPDLTTAWTLRGLCYENMKRFDDAVADQTEALKHSPNNPHVLLLRSRAFGKLNLKERADADYRAALESESLVPADLITRATARVKRGDPEGALEDLELAFQRSRRDAGILQDKASVLCKLGRYEEAIASLQQAVELDPSREQSLIDAAVLLARFGQEKQAKSYLRKAIRPPNKPRTLYQAACANALLGENYHKRALPLLAKALQSGYGAEEISLDDDLDSLREYSDFRSMLKTVELGNRLVEKKASRKQP